MFSVYWLDAARVLVAGVAIVEIDASRVTPIADVPEYAAVSATGAAWIAGESAIVRPWAGEKRSIALPTSHAAPDDDTPAARWVSWLGDGRLLLVEQDVNDGVLACDVSDPVAGTWTFARCPAGDFVQLGSIVLGPRGLYAIGSAGEGHPGLTLTRYSPDRGQRDLRLPWTDLYPFGWIDVTFHGDGTATLLTSCLLLDPDGRPCEGHEGDEQEWPLNAWRWRFGGRAAKLVGVGLPRGATVDPTGVRYAWAVPERLSVRRLDGGEIVHVKLPTAATPAP